MPKAKDPVYIIIPVHNRKTVTLKCLETLKNNGDLDQYHVIVVDDGSTDGTSEALVEQHPDVIILYGDGNLWWAGAINLGMHYAYEHGADYIIWLNDDTIPLIKSISLLVQQCQKLKPCILSGQAYESAALQFKTYGGQRRRQWKHFPVQADLNEILDCDSTSGNLACLPIEVIKDLGYLPSENLPHYQADVVYTWKAKCNGYRIAIVGKAIAICPFNASETSWLLGDRNLKQIWASFSSPKSPFYFKGYWNFCLSIWGGMGFLIFVQPYLRFFLISLIKWIFPKRFLQKVKH